MEQRTSKITKTKGKNRPKTTTKHNNEYYFPEIHKVRTKSTRKTSENNLMVKLHHFANVAKSTTATKAGTLNLSSESKALLENDYFKIINAKNTEFVAKPFVINKHADADTDFGDKIRCSASSNKSKNCAKFKDLVATKFKAKDRISRGPLALACRNINSMISIKDYHRVFCKKIFETRLFINGLLIYDHLKKHYSGVSVARNCFKKKFVNKLDKATKEIFPEMDTLKTTNIKENQLLQNVIDYYENQENNMNLFNEQMIQIPKNINKNDEVILECDEAISNRPITPVNDSFSPESFETPPSQRLVPIDLTASTTSASKYQTVFYEKDAHSGKTSLFEVPQNFRVTGTNADKTNREFKRIDVSSSASGSKGRVETARLVAAGKCQINDLEAVCDAGASPTATRPRRCPKKRLFHNYSDNSSDSFGFHPLRYDNAEANVFVRPVYSPKEFTEIRRNHLVFSPREFAAKQTYLQTLKVDELDFFMRNNSSVLKDISKIKTPEHHFYPFVQFNRK